MFVLGVSGGGGFGGLFSVVLIQGYNLVGKSLICFMRYLNCFAAMLVSFPFLPLFVVLFVLFYLF